MKNLIPMTDYVLEQYEKQTNPTIFEETTHNYAKFLKKPLKLEMFVPCDEDGHIIDKNYFCSSKCCDCDCEFNLKKAKEKVIFEGFTLYPNNDNFLQRGNILIDISKLRTVEDLIPYNLELTDNFKLWN